MTDPHDHDQDQQEPNARLYDRLLKRLDERREEWKNKGQEGLREEIDHLVEEEGELERLTRDEVALLSAWLKRDLADLKQYMEETGHDVRAWLAEETGLLGEQFMHGLRNVADPTYLGQQTLFQDLEARNDAILYHAGELAMAGRFVCTECDKPTTVPFTQRLEACHRCDGRVFRREGI